MANETVIQETKVLWDRSADKLYVWDESTKAWELFFVAADLVTNDQLTDNLALKLDKAGGTITGSLTVNNALSVSGAGTFGGEVSAVQLRVNGVPLTASLGFLYVEGFKVWDEGNDGTGSGLDADLLDGLDSGYFTDIPTRLGVSPQFSNATGSIGFTFSKHAIADDARQVFQTNLSTRAICGLLGDDNFSIKVSADGATYYTAINIDKSTGHVAIGTTADANNALSVAGSSALFTSPNGSFGFVFSKHATANDASLTFQDNFSTRAMIGLLANNDLTFKVTPDASTWKTGFVVNVSTGAVDHTQGAKFEALTNYDNYIASNTWTKVAFNAANHNDQSAFSASNNRFTAPVAGCYEIGFKLRFKANSTVPASFQGKFYKNGAALDYTGDEFSGTVVSLKTRVSYQTTMKLAAGDTIEVYTYMETNDGYVDKIESVFHGARIA